MLAEDKENFPYGNKSRDFLFARTVDLVGKLERAGCQTVILGCGTLSALVFPEIQNQAGVSIIDMITPTAKRLSLDGTVGILGTQNTIASEQWERQLQLRRGKFHTQACPELAPAIEQGIKGEQLCEIIYQQTAHLPEVDYLLLGCTHYPLARQEFQRVYPKARLIDPAVFVVAELKEKLKEGILCV